MQITPVQRFVLFGVVGTIGFFVDTGVLYLLKSALNLYVARLLSFLCAASATWLLNRSLTFRDRRSGHPPARELAIYIALMVSGGSVNYLVFVLVIWGYEVAELHPVLGVAAGSLAGMIVNLIASRLLLFRQARAPAVDESSARAMTSPPG